MTAGAPASAIATDQQSKPGESTRPGGQRVGTLLSVNVGLPKDVSWQGRIVFTGVFKDPVPGSRRVGRLNVDGDGQGDLAGHGGEQRAVFVYQIESYRYWERELGRHDFVYGQFGENFTVEGLGDDQVCIGDRYQIGSAVFEVTQPRVTCYRVGIRMNDPRIPALLVSHHRPGFYFRVLEEGEVQAGDKIIKLSSGPEQMTVSDVDALLYLPGHTRQGLLRALRVPALSPGWQGSFRALLNEEPGRGNAGLAVTSPPPAWPGFRALTVTAIRPESDSTISIRLEDPTGASLPAARPGQYLTLRVQPDQRQRALLRNYSLSGPPGARLLPGHRQARTRWRRQRLSAHPTRRRRPTRHSRTTRHVHPRSDARAGAADQRRDRCHPRSRHASGPGPGALRPRRSGACTAHATVASTRSPPRPGPSSPRCPTFGPTCTTAVPDQMTSKAATSTGRGASPPHCSPSWSHPPMPRHTCVGPPPSWTTSAPGWPP